MCKLKLPLFLQCLVFLIPVNYFVIGNGTGSGIQWALFKYQQDIFGNNFYSVTTVIFNLTSGFLSPHRALAAGLWIFGSSLLIGSFCLHVLAIQKKKPEFQKYAAIITFSSGIIYLISDIFHYGLLCQSPESYCIPVGIPVILVIGILGYRFAGRENCWDFKIAENPRFPHLNPLILLIFISVFVKIIVFSVSMFPAIVWVHQDVNLYFSYANSALSGEIPYIDYMIEYPQFFLIPVFIAQIPTLVLQNPAVSFHSFMILMYLFDTATLVCVYLIAHRLFGQKKALLCGLLYATAFAPAFYVALTYDSVPTFLLMLSVLMFVYGKEIPAYISASIGFLSKWFPVFCFPVYILYTLKNKKETLALKKGLVISFIIIALSIIPFIILNYNSFLKTYLFHFGREAYNPSLIYYLDVISKHFFDIGPFVNISLILLIFAESFLIYWYYTHLDGKEVTMCYVLLLSIFCFILLNKVFAPYYIVWILPLLALFFTNSYRQIILFYLVQLVFYFEEPILMERVVNNYSIIGESWVMNPLIFHPFVFYSIKFMVLFVVLYVIIRNLCMTQITKKEADTE